MNDSPTQTSPTFLGAHFLPVLGPRQSRVRLLACTVVGPIWDGMKGKGTH